MAELASSAGGYGMDEERSAGDESARGAPDDATEYTLFSESLRKIGARLAAAGDLKGLRAAVLVMSGAFNPIHVGHVRALEVASEFVQTDLGLFFAGALLSPHHDSAVRTKLRRSPGDIMPPRHRLRMCQETAAPLPWLAVDRWEVTRRAAMDHLAVLAHARELCAVTFPTVDCQVSRVDDAGRSVSGMKLRRSLPQVVYVCDGTDFCRAAPRALREIGALALTTCRLHGLERLQRTLDTDAAWASPPPPVGYLAEDTKMIAVELDGLSSLELRKQLKDPRTRERELASKMGAAAARVWAEAKLGAKCGGREPWTKADKQWSKADTAFMEATLAEEDAAAALAGAGGAAPPADAPEARAQEKAAAMGTTMRMANYK